MPEAADRDGQWPGRWAGEPYAYLTTIGRRTGAPHRIEIWFGVHEGQLYLLSGGRERSDWVRNLRANPAVTVKLGDETRSGVARIILPGTEEDRRARTLLVEKYRKDGNLDAWGRTSLPVAIGFPPDDGSASDDRELRHEGGVYGNEQVATASPSPPYDPPVHGCEAELRRAGSRWTEGMDAPPGEHVTDPGDAPRPE